MAYIVNPYNLDVEDDDALFAGALCNGDIWIEDDDDNSTDCYTDSVVEEAHSFLLDQNEEWVNFSTVGRHLHKAFSSINFKRLRNQDKTYKGLLQFFSDYPADFDLRQDDKKPGLYWIRTKAER